MADREKVINALECHADRTNMSCNIIKCPYYELVFCGVRLSQDVLELLKEQETEWEHLWDAPDGTYKGRCKKCGFVHYFIESHDAQYNFCPSCGRLVK